MLHAVRRLLPRWARRRWRRTSLDTRVTLLIVVIAALALAWVLSRPAPPPASGLTGGTAVPPCTTATAAPATCRTAHATLVLGRPNSAVRVGDAEADVLAARLSGSGVLVDVRLRNLATTAHTSPRTQVWLRVAGRRLDASQPVSAPRVAVGASLTRQFAFTLTAGQRRAVQATGRVDVGIAPFDRVGVGSTIGVVRIEVGRSAP